MRLIAPEDYGDFVCLASACRHSCCEGWEIDVDAASAARYQTVPGPFGERLRAALAEKDGTPVFRTDERGRCLLLREDGLCELILQLGEEQLCAICRDHPRFRSFFRGRTEIGLGLCCEEAARRLVCRTAPARLCVLSDDGSGEEPLPEEQELLAYREAWMNAVRNPSLSWPQRVDALLEEPLRKALSPALWADFLCGLEILDPRWPGRLRALKGDPRPLTGAAWDFPSGELAAYFLYRHLPGALEDGRWEARACLALLAAELIRALCACAAEPGPEDLAEAARLLSSELEYSEENLEAVLNRLEEVIACG